MKIIATVSLAVVIAMAPIPAQATRVVPGAPLHDYCPHMKGMQSIYDLNRTWVFKRPIILVDENGDTYYKVRKYPCKRINISSLR